MPASIFNGQFVKILKDALKFKSGGQIIWDYVNGCPSYPTPYTGVTNQIGQEQHIVVYNGSGGLIENGSAVYIMGADPDNTHPAISKGIASTYDASRIIGLTTHDIPDGEHGIVTSSGIVRDIDTSSFNEGDIVYLSESVAGEYSTTRPTDGSFSCIVGSISKIDAVNGEIFVQVHPSDYTVETVRITGFSTDFGPATLSFNDGDRTLTISPVGDTFHFYQDGVKYQKASDTYQIANTEGVHIVYYDMGVLTSLVNPTSAQVLSIVEFKPTVAEIYWNASGGQNEYVGNELHGCQFPSKVHIYSHKAYGARYISGLGLNTLSVDQSGDLAAHAQFGVDSGEIVDEDLSFLTTTIASTTGLKIYYLAGTSANPTLRSITNAGYSVSTTGSGRLAYNFLTGGNWTVAEVSNNQFALCHVFCINENTQAKRMVAFMGQNTYATVTLARAGAFSEIVTLQQTGITPKEIKSVATLVFQTSDGYANAVKSRIRSISSSENFVDWRIVNTTGGTVAVPGSTSVFADNAFQIFDNGDPTKALMFEVGNVTTGTTRIAYVPDRNVYLGQIQSWFTSTVYATTSTVYEPTSRKLYRCLIAHTSGTFATDLAAGRWGEFFFSKQIPLKWTNDSQSAAEEDSETFGLLRYGFIDGGTQKIKTSFRVPKSYVSGNPIYLLIKTHSATGSGTVLFTSTATLLRDGQDALSSTANQRTSTNSAVTLDAVNEEVKDLLDLSTAAGVINVAVSPDDTITIELARGAGTNTDKAWIIPQHCEVLI